MVTVPVLAEFTYQGRVFQVGESITVAPVEALALSRSGYVSISAGYEPKVLVPVRRRGRPATATKRTYRRRDLTPEV